MKLTIATPDKRVLADLVVEQVTIPAFSGELNVLPGHSPMMTTLETGVLKYKLPGKEIQNHLAISWGYCQVFPGGVNVLAEVAETPEEVSVEAANEKITRLEKKLGTEFMSDEEFAATQEKIALARAELTIEKYKDIKIQ